MNSRRIVWIIAIIVTALLSVAVARSTRLPGDVAVTGFLQSMALENNSWAEAITTSAKTPWNFLLLAITLLVSWLIAGWRAAVFAAVCFAGLLLIGPWLQGVIARPRPSPSLVRVLPPDKYEEVMARVREGRTEKPPEQPPAHKHGG